jgi:hypothetical protein
LLLLSIFVKKIGMDQDPLDLVMRGKGSPEDQLLEEIKEVKFKKLKSSTFGGMYI